MTEKVIVRDLKKSFHHLEVLKGIDLTVHEGEVVCIIGPSGGGKSTFLRCINRLEEPTGGEITVESVRQVCGLADQEYLFQLGETIANRDTGALLELIQRLGGLAVEYDRLCEQLIGHYRNLMVAKSAQNPADLILCLPEQLEDYRGQRGVEEETV